MNKIVSVASVVSAALAATLVGGCSTTSTTSNVDSQKVASIDRAARGRGVQVIWLNYPQRKVATAAPTAPTGS